MSNQSSRSSPRSGSRPRDYRPYDRLDLTGVHLHGNIITGNQGRAAMLRTAAERGRPARTVTRAVNAFGSFYVIQLGGDRDAGTVTLLGTHGPLVVRLGDTARHRILPATRIETLLHAIQADYPATTVTAALAEALAGVLDLCGHHRATGATAIPWRELEATLAAPLRAHIEAWAETRNGPTDAAETRKDDTP